VAVQKLSSSGGQRRKFPPLIIEGISILRGWELEHSSAIVTQRWGSQWKLSIVSMKELCPT